MSSDHTSVFLACPQSRSDRCGSNSVACLDGSHCAPRGTAHTLDSDKGADYSAPSALACSYVTSSPLFYHPFLESLPILPSFACTWPGCQSHKPGSLSNHKERWP